MSHHIETHGQDAAAIFARTDPWHRLGVTVAGDAFTAQDAMTLRAPGRVGRAQGAADSVRDHRGRCHQPGGARVRHGADQPVHRRPRGPRCGRRRGTARCRTRSTATS